MTELDKPFVLDVRGMIVSEGDFILSLASFASERGLSEKQREKADDIIRYYIK